MSKKKTHEEYVAELAVKNPNIEVIGEYVNANTKIMHHCLKHDVYFNTAPSNSLKGNSCCPKCFQEKHNKLFVKNNEDYIEELSIKNPDIEPIEKYINAKTKIKHHCKIHDIYWYISPTNALSGRKCPECHKDGVKRASRKTHEEYVKELKNILPHIEVIGKYINAKTKITHHCLIHDEYWDIDPDHLLKRGYGCKECGKVAYYKSRAKTHQQYVNELKDVNPNIKIVGKYINSKTPITHYCKKHQYYWDVTPSNMLRYGGCWKCRNEKLSVINTKTHEQYVNDLSRINPDIEVLGEYIDIETPILHKCLIHKYNWLEKPYNLLYNKCGCPQCHESSGERQVRKWLEKNNISYIYQKSFKDCRDINPLPFDFYLPEYNICIEYDGQQHYKSINYFGGKEKFELQQKHDKMKNEYCKNNGILLLRIPYYKNIEEELNNFLFI